MKKLVTLTSLFLASGLLPAQFSYVRPVEASEFNSIQWTAIRDFDGDGDLDMGMCAEEGIGWWRNDGQGSYADVNWVDHEPSTGYAQVMNAGDVDGDGDVDIVGGENYTALYLYTNDGSGNFAAPITVFEAEVDMRGLEVTDLTGDGLADILLADAWIQEVKYFPSLGGGQFGPEEVLSSMSGSAAALHVADFGGDGDNDVFFASSGAGGCYVCENQGGGNFLAAELLIPSTGDVYEVNTADLDGDGDLDIVTASYNHSYWYANDGNGSFGLSETIVYLDNGGFYNNAIADIDGDGDPDIVPATYEGQKPLWYANDGAGNFTDAGLITNATTFRLTFADMDGDSDADLVQVGRNALWWPNDGSGNMGPSTFVCGTLRNLQNVDLADMDGDGDLDALAAGVLDDRIVMFVNDGTGTLNGGQVALIDTVQNAWDLVPGDIDLDGDVDLVVLTAGFLYTFVNDGSGHMSFAQNLATGAQQVYAARLGDIDGDGDLDLVDAEYSPSRICKFINNGGSFGSPTTIFSGTGVRTCDLYDADGDGDLDLGSRYGSSTTHFFWIANGGTGNFGAPQDLSTESGFGGGCSAVSGDFDGDGVLDQLFATSEGLVIYRGLGGATFDAGVTVDGTYVDESDLYVVDLDSDGDPDIAVADKSGAPVRYYLNDGSGGFTDLMHFDASVLGEMASELAIGDLDGDGDPDALVGNMNGHVIYAVGMVENYFNSIYHIDGTVFHDINENGAQDAGEGPLAFVHVNSDPLASAPLTQPDGSYSIMTDPGDYQVSVSFPNAWWGLTTSPASYNVQLTTGTPVSTGNDFGYAPVVDTTVVELGFTGNIGMCGDTTLVFLNVTNLGTTQPSGSFCATIDTLFTIISFDPPPSSVTGNIYCWDIDSLYYYTPFTISAEVVVPDPSYMGTLLVGGVQMTETDGQGNVLQTWQEGWAAPLTCSYDPNYKEVEPVGYGEAGAVDIDTERLEYTIHFQNTGTAPAQNVVLTDRLADGLDVSSLQVLAYSHAPTSVSVETDRDLVIRFDGIQLPDSGASFTQSQGFIRFAVGLNEGLAHGTVIENTAAIHFDLNPPVITNTTVTTLVDCDLWSVGTIVQPNAYSLIAVTGDAYQWYLDGLLIPGATNQMLLINEMGDYTVAVTSFFGCMAFSDVLVVLTVGLAEQAPDVVAGVMPNPFSDRTEVVFSQALTTEHTIQLLDVNGRTVRELHANGSPRLIVQRDELASGLYTLRIVSPDRAATMVRLVVGP